MSFGREYFGKIDILVDDGLHSQEAILKSFSALYPALGSHGIYAIEDLIDHSFVPELVAELTAAINYWPSDFPTRFWPILKDLGPGAGWLAHNTTGIEFYRFVLFVKRGLNPRDNPFILNDEEYFQGYNSNLNLVAAAERSLIERGEAVTEEALVNIVGFQLRYYVSDYLDGHKVYKRDAQTGQYRPTAG